MHWSQVKTLQVTMAKNAHALVNGVPSFSQRVADQYLEVTDFFLVI